MVKVQLDDSVITGAAIFTDDRRFWRLFFGFLPWGGPLEGVVFMRSIMLIYHLPSKQISAWERHVQSWSCSTVCWWRLSHGKQSSDIAHLLTDYRLYLFRLFKRLESIKTKNVKKSILCFFFCLFAVVSCWILNTGDCLFVTLLFLNRNICCFFGWMYRTNCASVCQHVQTMGLFCVLCCPVFCPVFKLHWSISHCTLFHT